VATRRVIKCVFISVYNPVRLYNLNGFFYETGGVSLLHIFIFKQKLYVQEKKSERKNTTPKLKNDHLPIGT
jgi:hypothetical protein